MRPGRDGSTGGKRQTITCTPYRLHAPARILFDDGWDNTYEACEATEEDATTASLTTESVLKEAGKVCLGLRLDGKILKDVSAIT